MNSGYIRKWEILFCIFEWKRWWKRSMRGGKDEEKVTSPMFPRLHVNDTEKGGPKAPPRNKMALYEQLSIPSQRLASGSASMLSMPQNNGNSLVPSTPSSHVSDLYIYLYIDVYFFGELCDLILWFVLFVSIKEMSVPSVCVLCS